MENQIKLGEHVITYQIVRRKWSRGIRLTVKYSGEVRVSAPSLMPIAIIEMFLRAKSKWILQKIAYFNETRKTQPEINFTPQKIKELKKQTLEMITPKLRYYGEILSVKWRKVAVKNIRSRWGSCSRSGNLSFNCRMALLPEDLVDYIVVHELCHLRQFNHSPKFWALVGSILPDYQAKVKYLKAHVMALS